VQEPVECATEATAIIFRHPQEYDSIAFGRLIEDADSHERFQKPLLPEGPKAKPVQLGL